MAPLPTARPDEIGFDPQCLQLAFQRLDDWTRGAKAPIPGAALLVGCHGKVVGPEFFGKQGPEPDAETIRRDGVFLLASITKPITYLGAICCWSNAACSIPAIE